MPRQKQTNPKPLKQQQEEVKQLMKSNSPDNKSKTDRKLKLAKYRRKDQTKRSPKNAKTKISARRRKFSKQRSAPLRPATSKLPQQRLDGSKTTKVEILQAFAPVKEQNTGSPVVFKDKYDIIKERTRMARAAKNEENDGQKSQDKCTVKRKSPSDSGPGQSTKDMDISKKTLSVDGSVENESDKLGYLSLEKNAFSQEKRIVSLEKREISPMSEGKSILYKENLAKGEDEDNDSAKQQALEALLQITDVEFNTINNNKVVDKPNNDREPNIHENTLSSTKSDSEGEEVYNSDAGAQKPKLNSKSSLVFHTSKYQEEGGGERIYYPADAETEEADSKLVKKLGRHVCKFCGHRCAKPSVLTKHLRSHTGERPYPCIPCGFSFKTKSNLYKHRKSHAHAIKAGMKTSELPAKNSNGEEDDSEETESEDETASPGEKSLSRDSCNLNEESLDMNASPGLKGSYPRHSATEVLDSNLKHQVLLNRGLSRDHHELYSPEYMRAKPLVSQQELLEGSNFKNYRSSMSINPKDIAGFQIDVETRQAVPVLSGQAVPSSSAAALSETISKSAEQILIPLNKFNIIKSGGQYHLQVPVEGLTPDALAGISSKAEAMKSVEAKSEDHLRDRIQKLITDNEEIVDQQSLESYAPRSNSSFNDARNFHRAAEMERIPEVGSRLLSPHEMPVYMHHHPADKSQTGDHIMLLSNVRPFQPIKSFTHLKSPHGGQEGVLLSSLGSPLGGKSLKRKKTKSESAVLKDDLFLNKKKKVSLDRPGLWPGDMNAHLQQRNPAGVPNMMTLPTPEWYQGIPSSQPFPQSLLKIASPHTLIHSQRSASQEKLVSPFPRSTPPSSEVSVIQHTRTTPVQAGSHSSMSYVSTVSAPKSSTSSSFHEKMKNLTLPGTYVSDTSHASSGLTRPNSLSLSKLSSNSGSTYISKKDRGLGGISPRLDGISPGLFSAGIPGRSPKGMSSPRGYGFFPTTRTGDILNFKGTSSKKIPRLDSLGHRELTAKTPDGSKSGADAVPKPNLNLSLDIPSPLSKLIKFPQVTGGGTPKPSPIIDPRVLLSPEALSIAESVMRNASPTKAKTPSTPVEAARELGRLVAHAFHNAGGSIESVLQTSEGNLIVGPIATPTSSGAKTQIFILPSPSATQAPPFPGVTTPTSSRPTTPSVKARTPTAGSANQKPESIFSQGAISPRSSKASLSLASPRSLKPVPFLGSPRTPKAPHLGSPRIPKQAAIHGLPPGKTLEHHQAGSIATLSKTITAGKGKFWNFVKTNEPGKTTSSLPVFLYANMSSRMSGVTKVTSCCSKRLQPMYAPQGTNRKVSMYSNWKSSRNVPHPLGITWKEHLGMYDSNRNKKPQMVYMICDITPPRSGVFTESKDAKLEKEGQEKELDLEGKKIEKVENPHRAENLDGDGVVPVAIRSHSPGHYDTRRRETKSEPNRIPIFPGGFKSNEDYVYVRGRGRGKYVCQECGIRCKKPSMLKKHIRTHTDLRPYQCKVCQFAFKTKGNLTKHMKSKAHTKKCLEMGVCLSDIDWNDDGDDCVMMDDGDEHQFSGIDSEDTDSIDSDNSEEESEDDNDDDDQLIIDEGEEERRDEEITDQIPDKEKDQRKTPESVVSALKVLHQRMGLKRSSSENQLAPGRKRTLELDAKKERRIDELIGSLKSNSSSAGKPTRSEVVCKLTQHLNNRIQNTERYRHDDSRSSFSRSFSVSNLSTSLTTKQPKVSVGFPFAQALFEGKQRISEAGSSRSDEHHHHEEEHHNHQEEKRHHRHEEEHHDRHEEERHHYHEEKRHHYHEEERHHYHEEERHHYHEEERYHHHEEERHHHHEEKHHHYHEKERHHHHEEEHHHHHKEERHHHHEEERHHHQDSRQEKLTLPTTSIASTQFGKTAVFHESILSRRFDHREGNEYPWNRPKVHPLMMPSDEGTPVSQKVKHAPSVVDNQYRDTAIMVPPTSLVTPSTLVAPPIIEPISDDEEEKEKSSSVGTSSLLSMPTIETLTKTSADSNRLKSDFLRLPHPYLSHAVGSNSVRHMLLTRAPIWPFPMEGLPLSPYSPRFIPPSPSLLNASPSPTILGQFSPLTGRPPLVSPMSPSQMSQLPSTILSRPHAQSPLARKSPLFKLDVPSHPLRNSPLMLPHGTESAKPTSSENTSTQLVGIHSQSELKLVTSSPSERAESPENDSGRVSSPPTSTGPHKCSQCGRGFLKLNQLRIHSREHTTEQYYYTCFDCYLHFPTKSMLSRHERSQQHFAKVEAVEIATDGSDPDPRPFKCKECGIAFRIPGHLAKHLRSRGHLMTLERSGKLPAHKESLLRGELEKAEEGKDDPLMNPELSEETDSASEGEGQ